MLDSSREERGTAHLHFDTIDIVKYCNEIFNCSDEFNETPKKSNKKFDKNEEKEEVKEEEYDEQWEEEIEKKDKGKKRKIDVVEEVEVRV